MKCLKLGALSCVIAIVVITMFLSAKATKATSLNCGSWSLISSPNAGSNASVLNGVATVSTNNVWAVGFSINSNMADLTLVEHWNGTKWSVVSSPNAGSVTSVLNGVAAVSKNNVWAVGYHLTSSSQQTLIEHWNGTKWSIISSSTPGYLTGVTAVSATNIWAVGFRANSSGQKTLVEHWNGSNWSVVSSPNVAGSTFNELDGVAAVSATDIWAVGFYRSSSGAVNQTLVEHWNGTSWSIVSSPNAGSTLNDLRGVTRIPGTSHLWAVGFYSSSGSGQTLTEQWNGTSWSIVSSPNVGAGSNSLNAVAATSVQDAWAVGSYNGSSSSLTLTEHWNGTSWSVVSSPNAGSFLNDLIGVATISTQVWTVGYYNSTNYHTLTEFYC